MRFAVYINRTRKRACWHREGCGYIEKNGGTAERADQEWIWCDSVAAALSVLADKAQGFKPSDVGPCGRCRPDAPK